MMDCRTRQVILLPEVDRVTNWRIDQAGGPLYRLKIRRRRLRRMVRLDVKKVLPFIPRFRHRVIWW